MHSVFDPFCNPVSCEGNENDQAYNFGRGTTTRAAAARASRVSSAAVRFVLNVYRHQCDGKPGAKSQGSEPTNSTDKEDMAEPLGYIHCRLEHHHAERNPRYPADKTYDTEYPKYDKHYSGGVVMAVKVVYGSANREYDLQYPRDPLGPVSLKKRTTRGRKVTINCLVKARAMVK